MSSRTMKTSNLRSYFFEVEPVPASRPRVSRWGTYYGKRYEKFRREMREILREFPDEPLSGPLAVWVEFHVPTPKTTKREWPRGDVDNFVKGPLDSMTTHGGFWEDDDQIVYLETTKVFTKEGQPNGIRIRYGRCSANPPAL